MVCPCCQSHDVNDQADLNAYYECDDCGLVFKKDLEGPAEIARYYETQDPKDSVANSKDKFFDEAIKLIASKTRPFPTVLDVGCGSSAFLVKAKTNAWEPYGVEISTALAGEANRNLKLSRVFTGNLKQAAYSDRSFEAVTIWDTLIFSNDPFTDIQECHRILKSDGILGIRVRNVSFQKSLQQLYQGFYGIAASFNIKNPAAFHNYCYSKKSIETLMARVGFVNITVQNSPLTSGDPYHYARISCLTAISKQIVGIAADLVFRLSKRKLVVGPSLLAWAQKAS